MKQRTKEAIEKFAEETFPHEAGYLDPPEIEVSVHAKCVTIRVSRMYDYVICGLKELMAVSAFFDTTNVDDSRMHMNGCESCDWGSSYEITLTIRPETP